MKKFLFIFAVMIGMISLQSCTDVKGTNDAPEFVYNLTAQAEGEVDFNWFNGGASINGTAKVFQSNDTTKAFCAVPALDLNEALYANDAETVAAATQVRSYVDGVLTDVNGISGKWSVDLTGYVAYGKIVFAINEHWPKETTPDQDTTAVK